MSLATARKGTEGEHATQDAVVEFVEKEHAAGKNAIMISADTLQGLGVNARFPAMAAARWKIWSELGWKSGVIGSTKLVLRREDAEESEVKTAVKKEATIDEQEKIDRNAFLFPPETKTIKMAFEKCRPVFISGPTGSGKTELCQRLGTLMELPWLTFSFNRETTTDDLMGLWVVDREKDTKKSFEVADSLGEVHTEGSGAARIAEEGIEDAEEAPAKTGKKKKAKAKVDEDLVEKKLEKVGMRFIDGPLPKAMKEGKLLVLDEMDAGQPEVLFCLHAVLTGQPLINTKNGEIVVAAEGFNIAATANTVGRGDMTSLYTGTTVLNEAFLDRFTYTFKFDYPPPKTEELILTKRTGVSQAYAKQIVELANRARTAMKEGDIYSSFSVRKSLALAQALVDGIDLKMALRISVIDRVSDEDGKVLNEAAAKIWALAESS